MSELLDRCNYIERIFNELMSTNSRLQKEAIVKLKLLGYVAMIAENCSIKAPSLYKHYKSKREIFDAVYEKALNKYEKGA